MPNPRLIICDSDALIQLFTANEIRPLKDLKSLYGIQPVIVHEVDIELRWLGHHKDRFVPQLDKAVKSGLITRLDKGLFQSLVSGAPPGASWGAFQSLGTQYLGYVDKGEAYTHAAGLVLGMPTVSNDFRAIQLLQSQMMNLPVPVLRSFDLLAFALASGTLSIQDCENARSALITSGEGVPGVFRHTSFKGGLPNFTCRLKDSTSASATTPPTPTKFSDTLFVTKI
jgi:hypothetical protein